MKILKIVSSILIGIGFALFIGGVFLGMFVFESLGAAISIPVVGWLMVFVGIVLASIYNRKVRKGGAQGKLSSSPLFQDGGLPPIPTSNKAARCPRCNEIVDKDDVYCPKCGEKLK